MHKFEKMTKYILLSISLLFSTVSSAQFGDLLKKADKIKNDVLGDKNLNIGDALKEALEEGTKSSVNSLSAKDGYLESPFKILIPEEAQKVVSTVSKIPGFNNVENDLIAKMNEAAELAAKKATPIFIEAIKGITFKDATEILMGEKNAATTYLDNSSRDKLYEEFLPVIQVALDEVNARKYWMDVVSKYNKIPFIKKVNPELDDHVNTKALDGLFSLIEEKERGIREDVGQRTSPLLQEVFAKQDKE